MPHKLSIRGVSKSFAASSGTLSVLEDIDLSVADGELLVIVGHSGCGKSSLLKNIAGFEEPTKGEILLDGKKIAGPGPDRTMIFQEHRLFPWMTIEENVAFGLHDRPKAERRDLARSCLSLVQLEGFEESYPHELSGGMSQHAAIARALATRPEVLLLDEPFGALDALTKMDLQDELLSIRDREKTTMVMVTHDIEEAVYLADCIVVMTERPGKIAEIVPIELGRPRDRGSADFAWYQKRILSHFVKPKEKQIDYVI